MTPANIAAAQPLLAELKLAEDFAAGLKEKPIALGFDDRTNMLDISCSADNARRTIGAHIDELKADLRALGVVLEPDDAVMPEVKQQPRKAADFLADQYSCAKEFADAIRARAADHETISVHVALSAIRAAIRETETATPNPLSEAIHLLRVLCNTEIAQINRVGMAGTPGFSTINGLLKACDRVFAASDKVLP